MLSRKGKRSVSYFLQSRSLPIAVVNSPFCPYTAVAVKPCPKAAETEMAIITIIIRLRLNNYWPQQYSKRYHIRSGTGPERLAVAEERRLIALNFIPSSACGLIVEASALRFSCCLGMRWLEALDHLTSVLGSDSGLAIRMVMPPNPMRKMKPVGRSRVHYVKNPADQEPAETPRHRPPT